MAKYYRNIISNNLDTSEDITKYLRAFQLDSCSFYNEIKIGKAEKIKRKEQ